MNRRGFARSLIASAPIAVLRPAAPRPDEDLGSRADRSLATALRALVAAQSPDGAWRSTVYGAFKDGLALSPTVLKALSFGPEVAGSASARARGASFLAGRVRADGSIDGGPDGMIYPVYTASATILALSRLAIDDGPRVRSAWMRELRRRQLAEDLGWAEDDPGFGGWGYSVEPPKKSDGRAVDADLSSTLFAVGALRVSGAPADDPAVRKALGFVRRCQNFSDGQGDPSFDDGGFFFSPVDPARNKAGEVGVDRRGRVRFHSYGSTTADGLRLLMRCGLDASHPRVKAARAWIDRHFSAGTNPGTFGPLRDLEREGTFFYYAWSLSHALRSMPFGASGPSWAESIVRELIARQRPDGTWSSRFTAAKEDDPLVATPLAAGALGNCRGYLPP